MLILSNIAKLYDGTSASDDALHGGVDLWLDNGKIHDLRPHDPDLRVGSEHRVVDCSEYTVTPGLVDCHGHITALGLSPADFEAAMDRHVDGYVCEWKAVLDDPDKLSRFVSFVNAPGAPDPTVEFTEKNGRKVPVLIGTPSVRNR